MSATGVAAMKTEHKIFSLAVLIGAFMWAGHGALEYYAMPREGLSVWDMLLVGVSPHELPARLLFMVSCVVLGFVAARYARRRRLAANALREAEKERNAILDSMPEHVVYQDKSHRILWMNKAAADSLGGSADEYTGRVCHELWQQADTPCPGCPVTQAVETGQPHKSEMSTPDGKAWLVSGSPLMDERGRIIGAVEMTEDITARKKAEETLRHYERAVEGSVDLVAGVDRDYRYFLANEAFLKYERRSREEIIGRTAPEVLGESVFEKDVKHHVDRCLEGQIVRYEMVHDGPDGQSHNLEITYYPLRGDGPKPTGLVSVIRDITDRKRAEEALRVQRDFAQNLLDTAQVIVLVLDREGKVVRFNPFAQELTGYSEKDAVGKDWFATFLPDDARPQIEDLFSAVVSGETARGVVNTILARDGRRILVRWYNSLLRDAQGEVVGVLSIGNDITEAREKEEQLRQAVKMEAIGRLAGGIAHDFNNMMAIVQGYADLLGRSVSDDLQREDVAKIRTAASRAADLTKQLLAFSRRQVVQPRTIQLNDIILGMDSMLRRVIGEDVELATIAAERLWPVTADPSQIEQVILNLVVNAREAMRGGGKLTIRTANATLGRAQAARLPDVAPGQYAVLSVSDTGVGMTDEVKAHAFEPFFTTKEVGEGTGLGLATCYGIIKQNDGHVEVESEPGKGTTFRVYLPRRREPAETVEQELERPEESLTGGRETILVAEDEEPVRQLVVRILREAGYTVLETANAREALPLGEHYAGRIHLLVTDVIMPGTGGSDLAARLVASRSDMKVLFISGYADQPSLGQGLKVHDGVLLAKPFSPGELTRAVRRALGGSDAEGTGLGGAEGVTRASEKLPRP